MQLPESDNPNHANPPATSALHSWVYLALIGLALWMVLWVWSFVGNGETDYILFIVTGFIVTVVALQVVLMRVRRADKTSDSTAQVSATQDNATKGVASFREWAHGLFEAERSRMRAGEAALLILLPIAAAAIGMMAFGIEYMIVEHAAGM
jgi:type VI protein secretion system component VasK